MKLKKCCRDEWRWSRVDSWEFNLPDDTNFRRKKKYTFHFSFSQRVSFREFFRIKFGKGIFREFSRDGKEKEGDGSEVVNGFNGRRRETIESFLFQDFQKKGNRRDRRCCWWEGLNLSQRFHGCRVAGKWKLDDNCFSIRSSLPPLLDTAKANDIYPRIHERTIFEFPLSFLPWNISSNQPSSFPAF